MGSIIGGGTAARFPDVIIGLGGAGKNLVFNMLNHDWFIKKIIESNQSVRFVVIDTATTEYKDDVKIKEKIEEKIEKISKELDMPNRYIDVDVVCLTENLNLIGIADLIDEYSIKKAKNEGYVNTWWLYDPENGIDIRDKIKKTGGEDFAHGTYRRRGLTKAVFYKAKAEGAVESSFKLSIGAGSTVALITGAGGGTGSGLVIDIAKYVKERYPNAIVDLFLILPSIYEGDHEKSNAYAILSELEYDRLIRGKDALFRNVILHPIERTKYRGGDLGAYSNKHKELLEFDEMFTYILYDYYKLMTTNAKTRIEDNIHKYCGYLLATGGVIRYNIAPIKESKEELSKYLDMLQRGLDIEKELRNEINKVIDKFEDIINDMGGTLQTPQLVASDMDYVMNRFRGIFDTIIYPENDKANPFSLLEYESPKKVIDQLKNYIEQGVDIREWAEDIKSIEELKDKVAILKRIASNLDSVGVVYKDETDRRLLNIIVTAMENIETLINQLEKASTLDFDTLISNLGLEDKIKSDELMNDFKNMIKIESGFSWLNGFKIIIQKLNSEIKNTEYSIRSLNKEIAELSNKFEKDRSKLDDILSIIMPEINKIWELKKELQEITSPIVDNINSELAEFCNILNETFGRGFNKDVSKLPMNIINSKKEELINIISSSNIPESSKNELKEFIDCVENIMKSKYLEKYYNKKLKGLSMIDRLLGKDKKLRSLSSKANTKYKEYVKKLSLLSNDLAGCYTPGGQLIPPSVKEYLSKSVEMEIHNTCKTLISKLENNRGIELSNDELLSTVLNASSKENLKEGIEKLVIKNLKEFSELSQKINDLESKLKSMDEKLKELSETYEKLNEIYNIMEQSITTLNDRMNSNLQNAKITMAELMTKLKEERDFKKMDFAYISKLDPSPSIMGAVNKGSLKQIFESSSISDEVKKKEKRIINSELELLVQRYLVGRYQEYLGIDSVSILIKDEKGMEVGRWTPILSYAVINAPGDIIERETVETIEKIMKNVLQTNPRFTEANIVEDCGDWDVAISLFVGPVSMDNIHSVKIVGGYMDTYKKIVMSNNNLKPEAIFHHVYGLEDGYLIIRNGILSKEEFATYAKKENNGEDISDDIVNKVYERKDIRDIINQ